jgi:hypothetical protein
MALQDNSSIRLRAASMATLLSNLKCSTSRLLLPRTTAVDEVAVATTA